jgi:hypothetical protein
LPYRGTWDPDSQREYTSWLASGKATVAQKRACAKLLAAFREGILDEGPEGMAGQPPQVPRSTGAAVDIYCHGAARVVARCFAVDEQAREIRLLVIGPFNDHKLLQTARDRAARW